MSILSNKIRILRQNKEWTQAQLAESLSLSESAVQKWEKAINTPPVEELKRLAEVFAIPVSFLIDDTIKIFEYRYLHSIPTDEIYQNSGYEDSEPHKVFNANLRNGAKLHRFTNKAGVPYSAIYFGKREMLSCEHEAEQNMVTYWNKK